MVPEQKVYTTIRRVCAEVVGESNVYDRLPGGSAPYPFVTIGDQFAQTYREHKDATSKDTQVIIHVWCDDLDNRGDLTSTMSQIIAGVQQTYGVKGEIFNTSVITDRTTNRILRHGIIDTNIKL